MRLPKKIKIAGLTYTVEFPYRFNNYNTPDRVGTHLPGSCILRISDVTAHGQKRKNDVIMETFLHEAFHAVDLVYSNRRISSFEDSHNLIEALANGWYQVLKGNNIMGDKIPKKIKIGGLVYNVIYPCEYEVDDDKSNIIKHEEGLVEISYISNQTFEFVQFTIIKCINWAVLNIYASGFDFEKFDMNDSMNDFTSGLHQFFKDNKIQELVKGVKE